MPIHEFTCSLAHTTEEYFSTQESVLEKIECPQCGYTAFRDISLSNFDFPNLPKIIDEKHKHRMGLLAEKKAEQNHREEKIYGW